MYTRLVLQATMFVDTSLQWQSSLLVRDLNEPFSSLQHARDSLDVLLGQIYLLPDNISLRKPKTAHETKKQIHFATRLSRWSESFAHYLSTTNTDESIQPRATMLELWYITATIMLFTSLSNDETDFDRFIPDFDRIVDPAECLLATKTSHFSIDIGAVPLLYYVAVKCRHPITRRKTITLLAAAPRREGVWDSIGTARVAQEIVGIEEEGLDCVRNERCIPGSARIHNLHVDIDLDNRSVLMQVLHQGDKILGTGRVVKW